MSTQSPRGAPDGQPSPRSRTTLMLVWFVVILAAAAVVWLLLALSGVADAGSSLVVVAWVMIVLSLGLSSWTRRRQQRRYRAQFPSLDDLRRHVDAEALRALRDRDGQVQAVRELRRRVPEVPLGDAAQLIKSL